MIPGVVAGGARRAVGATDPFFNSVSLLLHMDGPNGGAVFTDSSPRAKIVTPVGNTQISTEQSKFGGASGFFDGDGDYLTVPYSSDIDISSGNFTIEGWFYLTNLSANCGLMFFGDRGSDNNRIQIHVRTTGQIVFYFQGSSFGADACASAESVINAGVWNHVAAVVNGISLTLFVNGVSVATIIRTVSLSLASNSAYIGLARILGEQIHLNGYADDVRFTKGVARYTANFTPPTAPFPNS
jgi:hypothetical protein